MRLRKIKNLAAIFLVISILFGFSVDAVMAEEKVVNSIDTLKPSTAFGYLTPINKNNYTYEDSFDESLANYLNVEVVEGSNTAIFDTSKQIILKNNFYMAVYKNAKPLKYKISVSVKGVQSGNNILPKMLLGESEYINSESEMPVKFKIVNHPVIRARQMHIQGKSTKEIAGTLQSEFNVNVVDAAQILTWEKYSVVEIGQALNQIYKQSPVESATILKQMGFSPKEIGTSLKDVFSEDSTQASEILKQVGFNANEIGEVLKVVFSREANDAAFILKSVGFDAVQVGTMLSTVFEQTSDAAALILKQIDFSVREIGTVLKNVFNKSPKESAIILNQIEFDSIKVGIVLKDVYVQTPEQGAIILKEVGFELTDVASSLKEAYELSTQPVLAASALNQAGFAGADVCAALKNVFDIINYENVTVVMKEAGFAAIDIANGLKIAYNATGDEITGSLKKSGFDVYAVTDALMDITDGNFNDVAKWLGLNDYSAGEFLKAALKINGLSLELKLKAAKAAGYALMDLGDSLRSLDNTISDVDFARIFKASGFLPGEIGTYLKATTQCSVETLASICYLAGFTAVETVNAIQYSLAELKGAGIKILKNAGYEAFELGNMMYTTYGQTAEQVADLFLKGEFDCEKAALALKAIYFDIPAETLIHALNIAGYALNELSPVIKNVFNKGAETTAAILKQLGYSAVEIGESVHTMFNTTGEQTAQILKNTGFIPNEVADAVGDVFGLTGDGLLVVMKGVGYTCDQLADISKTVLGWTGEQTAAGLKGLGYAVNEVGSALKVAYNYSGELAAQALKGAGYAIDQVASALQSAYGYTQDAVEDALSFAGYAANEIGSFFESLVGGSIICTELHRQGLMDDKTYAADEEYGKILRSEHLYVIKGYHYLAAPIVSEMRVSKTFTKVVHFFAAPWANEMAHQMGIREKGDIAGKLIMIIGMPICAITGVLISSPLYMILLVLMIAGAIILVRRNRLLKGAYSI